MKEAEIDWLARFVEIRERAQGHRRVAEMTVFVSGSTSAVIGLAQDIDMLLDLLEGAKT